MATLTKAMKVSKGVHNVTKLFTNLSLTSSVIASPKYKFRGSMPSLHCAFIHITSERRDLMEFFDEPKNWEKNEVKVGRSWRMEELRLKSNSDLHKLWFVLLKERNMLMTMEQACKDAFEIFPSPERLDKVQDSMNNLETVVRERNRAYHLLETGETGERPGKLVHNRLGMRFYYRMRQYAIPKFMNTKWHKMNQFGYGGCAVQKFRKLYKEKLWNEKRKARNREVSQVSMLLRRFPNVDIDALKEQYPNVDVEKIKLSDRARSHTAPQ